MKMTLLDSNGQAHPIDMLRSSFSSKHAEYARPTANIQNNLSTKQVLVVVDGIAIGQSSYLVLQHLLVDT